MLKFAICDDDKNFISYLELLLDNFEHTIPIEYTIYSAGVDLISVLERGKNFDIYILDILLSGYNGINLAGEIRLHDKIAKIIFVTSSPEFALESYSVKAYDYLIKPITAQTLYQVLANAIHDIEYEKQTSVIARTGHEIKNILLSHLILVEALGRKVCYHTIDGDKIESIEKFADVCIRLLDEPSFIKPHRSYIINMSYIDKIVSGHIVMQNGDEVPIAQGKLDEIKTSYLKFQMVDYK